MVNHLFVKWLAGTLWTGSVHVVARGEGEVRFTSFCRRHWYAVPSWATWVVLAAVAFCRPLTTWPPIRPQSP